MLKLFPHRDRHAADAMQRRYPAQVIGRHSYGSPKLHDWGEGARLHMGAFCSVAEGVEIFLGGEHRTDWLTTFPFNLMWPQARGVAGHPHTKGDVRIGNDVWLGYQALVMSGVTIGDGAVIGARAVVSRDVPPYAIVAGNPAQVRRFRFDEHTVQRLLELRWWNWSDEQIARHLPLMLSGDLPAFLKAAAPDRTAAGAYASAHAGRLT